jgi:colicin import membrane protein
MRTGLTISGAGHAAVLLWSVLTLAARPYHVDPTQALPIDVISSSEFAQMTNGAPNAPPAEHPKPVVDKVDKAVEPVPVDDPTAKLAKKEIKAATDVRAPEPKPPEPKAKKPPQQQAAIDPIADALKKDEDKKPDPKKPDPKPPTPPKKPVQQEPAPQFDPGKVALLLDKRAPQREANAGNGLSNTSSPGGKGFADQLSQSETGALRARLTELWNVPAGGKDLRELILDVEIKFNPDGTLAGPPTVLTGGNSPLYLAARDSAVRAVYRGQPYTMLRPEHYELWKDIVVTFDPQQASGN